MQWRWAVGLAVAVGTQMAQVPDVITFPHFGMGFSTLFHRWKPPWPTGIPLHQAQAQGLPFRARILSPELQTGLAGAVPGT